MDREEGFTLLELIVSIAILALIASAVVLYVLSSQRAFFVGQAKVRSQEAGREVLELITRDIRHAGYRHWRVAPHSIHRLNLAYNNTINIQADLNLNGTIGGTIQGVNDTGENITYRFIPPTIQRRDAARGNWETVANNIEWLNFSYLDANNNLIPFNSLGDAWRNNDSVRVVRIGLRAVERYGNTTQAISLNTDIKLRNTFFDSN